MPGSVLVLETEPDDMEQGGGSQYDFGAEDLAMYGQERLDKQSMRTDGESVRMLADCYLGRGAVPVTVKPASDLACVSSG